MCSSQPRSFINVLTESLQLNKINFISKVPKYSLTPITLSSSPSLHHYYYLLGPLSPLQCQQWLTNLTTDQCQTHLNSFFPSFPHLSPEHHCMIAHIFSELLFLVYLKCAKQVRQAIKLFPTSSSGTSVQYSKMHRKNEHMSMFICSALSDKDTIGQQNLKAPSLSVQLRDHADPTAL